MDQSCTKFNQHISRRIEQKKYQGDPRLAKSAEKLVKKDKQKIIIHF